MSLIILIPLVAFALFSATSVWHTILHIRSSDNSTPFRIIRGLVALVIVSFLLFAVMGTVISLPLSLSMQWLIGIIYVGLHAVVTLMAVRARVELIDWHMTGPYIPRGWERTTGLILLGLSTASMLYTAVNFKEFKRQVSVSARQKDQITFDARMNKTDGETSIHYNDELGLSFSYPSSWKIEDSLKSDYTGILNIFNSQNPYQGDSLRPGVMKAQVQPYINSSVSNKEQYIDNLTSRTDEMGVSISRSSIDTLSSDSGSFNILRIKGGVGSINYVVPIRGNFKEILYVIVWNPDIKFEKVLTSLKLTQIRK